MSPEQLPETGVSSHGYGEFASEVLSKGRKRAEDKLNEQVKILSHSADVHSLFISVKKYFETSQTSFGWLNLQLTSKVVKQNMDTIEM